MPLREVLRNRATWAFFFGKLMSDPIWWFFLFWLPKFLHDKHHVELTRMGAPLVTIYTITIFGSIGATIGWMRTRAPNSDCMPGLHCAECAKSQAARIIPLSTPSRFPYNIARFYVFLYTLPL